MMKCSICDKQFEDDDCVQIVNGEAVHRSCYIEKQQEEERMKQEAVEVEYTDATEDATEEVSPKCEIIVGMEQNGNLYFQARGVEPSLLNIEGLLKFAQLKMRKIWDERMSKG